MIHIIHYYSILIYIGWSLSLFSLTLLMLSLVTHSSIWFADTTAFSTDSARLLWSNWTWASWAFAAGKSLLVIWWNCNYQICHDGHRKIIQIPRFAWHLLWGAHVRKVALCKSVFNNIHPRILFVSWSSLRDAGTHDIWIEWTVPQSKPGNRKKHWKHRDLRDLRHLRDLYPLSSCPAIRSNLMMTRLVHEDPTQASSLRNARLGFLAGPVVGCSHTMSHLVRTIPKGSNRYLKKSGIVF